MRLLFLAPLLTGLFCAYIARRSQDEMAYLTSLVAGVSLLLSLTIAPWQVQLLILLLVLSTVGYVWKQSGLEGVSEVQQFESAPQDRVNPTQERNPVRSIAITPEVTDRRKVRKYRGVIIDETPSEPATTPSNLKYRGASVDDSSLER